ncbi:MAG: AAA family ATPase [Capsulimonadaceae bacterium]
MIGDITIENFKSITKLELPLGRINVLIGANGCGKSNILEAIALCAAAAADKLDNEFLSSRGIRVPDDPSLLTPSFDQSGSTEPIRIRAANIQDEYEPFECVIHQEKSSQFLSLNNTARRTYVHDLREYMGHGQHVVTSEIKGLRTIDGGQVFLDILDTSDDSILRRTQTQEFIQRFLVYSPENSVLRPFALEGQITPLGINGQGLFRLLNVLISAKNAEPFTELKEQLRLIDWFEDFDISPTMAFGDRSLRIKDRYFDPTLPEMSQLSSNEGFLFLLFYFSLFISDLTPKFFAIDNIDASLNPKLCARLMVRLTDLAKKHDKQVIFTTHNPAVLDGLNLDDDEQRLFVVYRNDDGHTTARRVLKPEPLPGQRPVKLSEAFMRGYIGGLPDNF